MREPRPELMDRIETTETSGEEPTTKVKGKGSHREEN